MTHSGFLAGGVPNAFSERPAQSHSGNLQVPINMPSGQLLEQAVRPGRVELRSRVVWYGRGDDPFYHEERFTDGHLARHDCTLTIVGGRMYGSRHPILHPAVAAVDMATGGIDDAFLRAMQNIETLVGSAYRTEASITMRVVAMQYSQLAYNPVRVLVRAAALLANMYSGHVGEDMVDYRPVDVAAGPTQLQGMNVFSGFMEQQYGTFRDVLYIACEHISEMYMVDVMHALCSREFPMPRYASACSLWPALNNPVVAYSGGAGIRIPPFKMSVNTLLATMHRFCSIFDCHDLWGQALGLVQSVMFRVPGTGMLGALSHCVLELPTSDMRVGAIGPLLAGLSAEGRSTTPVRVPLREEFLYSAAVRGVYLTAAYYEVAQRSCDAHPVAVAMKAGDSAVYNGLVDAEASRQLMENSVKVRAAEMGWDCVEPLMYGLRIPRGKNWQRAMFRPHMVPWWTTVCNHLNVKASAELADWLRPSVPTTRPMPNAWQPFHAIGKVTGFQIAAAIRWMGAEVAYSRVSLPYHISYHKLVTGDHKRFLPAVEPSFRLSGHATVVGSVKFPAWGYEGVRLVEQLAKADCCMYGELPEEATYDYGIADASTFTGMPEAPLSPPLPATAEDGLEPSNADVLRSIDERDLGTDRTGTGMAEDGVPTEEEDAEIVARMNSIGMYIKPGSYRASFSPVNGEGAALARGGALDLAGQNIERLGAKGASPEQQLAQARAFVRFGRRMQMHAESAGMSPAVIANKVNLALDKIVVLKQRLAPTSEMPSPAAVEEAALREGVLSADADDPDIVLPAVDDPSGPDLSVQDFGSGTSALASGMGGRSATDVPAHTQALPSIGFQAPDASGSSSA